MNSQTDNLELEFRQSPLGLYLGLGSGSMVLITSFLAGASMQAVILRTVIAGFGMYLTGKLAGRVLQSAWEQAQQVELGGAPIATEAPASPGLGKNIDIRLDQEQAVNSQIAQNLQQELVDNPERVANLARKMGATQ